MQVKTIIRYHFTLTRMVIIKTHTQKISIGEDVEKLEPLHIAVGNIK